MVKVIISEDAQEFEDLIRDFSDKHVVNNTECYVDEGKMYAFLHFRDKLDFNRHKKTA